MSRKQLIWLICTISLFIGGIVLLAVRWNAWFVNPAEPRWNGDTISAFYTMPDTFPKENAEILVLGDVHNLLSHTDWVSIEQRWPELDAFASVGDLLERGNGYYWQKYLHEIVGTKFQHLPMMAIPGNHEYKKGVVRHLPECWNEMFRMPANGPVDFVGSTYFVDFPEMRVIMVNTAGLQFLRDYVRTYTWTKRTMQEVPNNKFIVVMMHHPVYSSASYRLNIGEYLTFAALFQDADIVFSGHDHSYMRRTPYIGLISARRFLPVGNVLNADCLIENQAVYTVLSASKATLKVHVYSLDDHSLIDEVVLTKDTLENIR